MPDLPPFEEVFAQHKDRVYRYLLLQLRNPAEAEDVAADVFLAAFRAYARVAPPPERVHMWLLRIARNRAGNWRRHAAVVVRVLPRLGIGEVASPENQAILAEDLRQVLAAMAKLKPRDRRLLALRLGGGMSNAEIGAALGMSEAAVTVAYRRALDKLRSIVGEEQ